MEKQTLKVSWSDITNCYEGIWIIPEIPQTVCAFGTSVESILEKLLDGQVQTY